MTFPKKNGLEWLVFGLSLVLLLGTIVYLAIDALGDAGRPAEITIEFGEVSADGPQFRVPVQVTNGGDEAAEQVEIRITSGGESTGLIIALLPSKSSAAGHVDFEGDPRPAGLQGRVVGYLEP
jgi:uncharacterized protein (TIGR02588 family)